MYDDSRRIFLSYRRSETRHAAGRIADRLGAHRVFMDVEALEPGAEFIEAIAEAVRSSAVLIAVIGPGWLDATDRNGRRRLMDPEDLVAREIGEALRNAVPVIPVLVDGAEMPSSDDLPTSLHPLAGRHAIRMDHETFSSDMERLSEAVERNLTVTRAAAIDPDIEFWIDGPTTVRAGNGYTYSLGARDRSRVASCVWTDPNGETFGNCQPLTISYHTPGLFLIRLVITTTDGRTTPVELSTESH